MKGKFRTIGSIIASSTLALSLFVTGPQGNIKAEEATVELVNESFENVADGSLPEHWNVIEGDAEVQDGKLVLTSPATSSPSRVSVPIAEEYGDYMFEADMTFVSAVENTRWASLMYRIQNEDYPYYQFAVRKGTSALNGLEFATRNASNRWSVTETNFYKENFEYGKSYRLKVIVSGDRVQQFVDGELVIDTDGATQWSNGDVGFQASGSTVQFDNVQVTTYNEELPPAEDSDAFLPQEAETNIINPPTIIAGPDAAGGENKAASAMLKVERGQDGTLEANGEPLNEQLQSIKNENIAVLHVEEEGLQEEIVQSLEATQTTDVHVVSSNPAIIEAVKGLKPQIRGGLVYDGKSLNKNDLEQIPFDVHSSKSKVVLIPQKLLSQEIVYYLHNRMVAAWGIGGDSLASTHELIHMGVDGVITDNPEYSEEAFSQYPVHTIVQRPIVAAHRGVPSLAPENTMAGYRLAYDLEADMIETDLHMTKDGHVIVMHDYTVDRTTDGTGAVKDMTLEEIKKLDAGIKFGEEFAGEPVPTFKEFLQEFKGKDVVLLVELKGYDLEEQVLEEIKEMDMMNQVVLQNFDLESMKTFNQLEPKLATGYLFSAGVPNGGQEKLDNAKKMVDYGTTWNVTLNASYGTVYREFLTYMRQRGMLSMHWTFRAEDPFADKLREGLIGPITDYTQWLTHSPINLETPIKKVNLKVGKSRDINAKAFLSYRTGETENIETELYTMNNDGIVEVEGNNVEALSPGTAQVFVKHTFTMLDQEWNLVSEPIQVNVSE
ncbi:glycerophosphodiester phosphodiesterase family protein [Bacillus sp. Marseille-Q3570]|uniref:glycerophosphodiester phosphodiesterase family protein n=1 Tax=Bacillus sp. Marseille-Q3570 TaxID=2963522 RepID=UPI0021B7BF77|nr:glycerophosphodiester phosphodiesterase family protein [Bacillus sp. Marseille-Q3570]